MKLTTIVFGLLLIPNISFAAAFDHNMYYGLHGTDIVALQEFLTIQGDYSGPITGNFYSLTLQGVKNFQSRNTISPVSGFFGILSRGIANAFLNPIAPIEETGTTTAEIKTPTPIINSVQTTYFTPPVVSIAQQPANGVQTPTIPNWTINVVATNGLTTLVDTGLLRFEVSVNDKNGVYIKQPVTVTTDDPDLPSIFTLNAPGQVYWFCVAPTYDGFPNQGCKNEHPVSVGIFNITFTVEDVSVTKEITIQ